MRHKVPDRIKELFSDEYTAMSEGRGTFIEWLKTLDLNVGDEIEVPSVGGAISIWKSTETPKRKIQ